MQYRRLTAHLNSHSSDFNRRLAAYLTNQVAMRSALDQAITNSYGPNFLSNNQTGQNAQNPGAQQQPQPQSPHNQQATWMQNSPFINRNSFTPIMPPNMQAQSPTSLNQPPQSAPPHNPYFPQNQALKSPTTPHTPSSGPVDSPTTPHALNAQSGDSAHRRLSAPPNARTASQNSVEIAQQAQQGSTQRTSSISSLSGKGQSGPEAPNLKAEPSGDQPAESKVNGISGPLSPQDQSSPFPLTTTLGFDAQMFLGSNFDINSFSSQSNDAAFNNPVQALFYSYNPNQFNKPRTFHPSYDGMNQTLAPGALDTKPDQFGWSNSSSAATDSVHTPYSNDPMSAMSTDNPFFSSNFSPKGQYDLSPTGELESGGVTPGEPDWNTFLDSSQFEERAA